MSLIMDKRRKAIDIAVYSSLYTFSEDGMECDPAHGAIAERAHVGIGTVIRSLKRLTDMKYISQEKRKDSKGGKISNKYTFLTR